ncbi:unnamed protein product [Prunus brigantina]
MCGLCEQYEESIEHALLLCPWAQAVWFGSPMTLRIDTQSFSTLDVWLNSILDLRTESKMEKHDLLTMLSFFLWEIWKTRCKAIMEGCRIDPCKVVETAGKAKVEFQKVWQGNANNETSRSPSIGEVCSWEPPPMGFVKVNIDGSWQSNGRKAGVGVVIRNSVGEFLGGMAASRVGHSALEMEAEAAVLGLDLAANLGYSDVYVESDSKTLVDGINGEIRHRAWTIRPSIEVIWRWVQRSSNRAAHEAAAIGSRAVELESWVTQPPLSLIHVLVSDGLPGPP